MDGQSERTIQTLKDMLRAVVEALERKSDEKESGGIEEERMYSNVKSGDLEELDLEEIQRYWLKNPITEKKSVDVFITINSLWRLQMMRKLTRKSSKSADNRMTEREENAKRDALRKENKLQIHRRTAASRSLTWDSGDIDELQRTITLGL
ncbi:hypothetical protein Tco_0854902 [Tanacetum coccineum]